MSPRISLVAGVLLPWVATPSVAARAASPTASDSDGREAVSAYRRCVAAPAREAVDPCRAALALAADDERRATLLRLLVADLAALGRWEEARAAATDLVGLRPEDGQARVVQAEVLFYGLDQPGEALLALEEARRLLPGDPQPAVEQGVVLAALGRTVESLAAFEEALRRDPDCLEAQPAAAEVWLEVRRSAGDGG